MAKKSEPVRQFDSLDAFIAAHVWHVPPDESLARATYENAVGRLRKLEGLVRPAVGQLVLVVWREVRTHGCAGGMRARLRLPITEETYDLGILTPPGFRISALHGPNGWLTCMLTTERHAHIAGSRRTSVHDGPIADNVLRPFWKQFNPTPPKRHLLFEDDVSSIEVYAGDQAIYAWAERTNREILLWTAARLLKVHVDFPKLWKRLEQERVSSARAIERLWAKRFAVRERIEVFMQSVRDGRNPVIESEADARFITVADREQLQRMEADLKRHLEKLKEYGLTDQTPNIHFIRHVAQQLGVELG